jgi:hypothetical protein
VTSPDEPGHRAAFDRRDQAYARWEWLLAGVVLGAALTAVLTAVIG